jgi:hypothetical protein
MEEVTLDVMKRLTDAIIREYLIRNNYSNTLNSFNQENPKPLDAISTKKELLEILRLSKEAKINKQRGLKLENCFIDVLQLFLLLLFWS